MTKQSGLLAYKDFDAVISAKAPTISQGCDQSFSPASAAPPDLPALMEMRCEVMRSHAKSCKVGH